jgi:hypothetical protein
VKQLASSAGAVVVVVLEEVVLVDDEVVLVDGDEVVVDADEVVLACAGRGQKP